MGRHSITKDRIEDEVVRSPIQNRNYNLTMDKETRPDYILVIRAQALDRVQELIQPDQGPWVHPPLPTQEQWDAIVEAAFPPPPMA